MLEIKQIESFYPEVLRGFKRNLLREYLQYKILEIIFESPFASSLSFMGGTAIRIIHGQSRFSEDLDFDNRGLNRSEFAALANFVKKKLSLQGYHMDSKNIFKGAFRSYLRIEDILFQNKLSSHREEKLMIQLDMEPQRFSYEPEQVILNKFDVFLRIAVVPMDILLAQKIYAILNRKRPMGRDFFDAVFLLGKIQPNKNYLKQKLNILNGEDLKRRLLRYCQKLDFQQLAKDVKPFLMNPDEIKRIILFPEYIEKLNKTI